MRLTIAQRLILGFAFLIILTIGFGWYQVDNLQQMRNFAVATVERDFRTLQLLRQASIAQHRMESRRERAIVTRLSGEVKDSGGERSVAQREWQIAHDRTVGLLRELGDVARENQRNAETLSRAELWKKVVDNTRASQVALKEISSVVTSEFDALNAGQTGGLQARQEILDELRRKLNDLNERGEDLTEELASSAKRDIEILHASVNQTTVIVLAGIFTLGIIVAVAIYRSITGPLTSFMGFVEGVGKGNLMERTANTGSDELGQLGVYLNDMVENLAAIAQQTRGTAENLNAATAEMQSSAQQQAASTSEQSAAVQQITSTLDEIAQSGTQISERAKSVATSAEAAATASRSGLEAVSETGRAIRSIRDQAERVAGTVVALTEKTQSVGEIIASVNEIAERSNLLALNAAIEASAAGESGKTFAIVADEIKNLAEQAKEATSQVHGLLSEIQHGINSAVMQTEEAVKRAEFGNTQSEQTERTITELVQSVEQSIATFQQILAATNQQQIGVEQVSDSVRNIREASEQIAAGIRELERASGSMNAMSSQLRQSIERYQL